MLEQIMESVRYLETAFPQRPALGLVLGSGLGPLAEELEDAVSVPFAAVPHMAGATAPDHAGQLICGRLEGQTVLCMQGRLHGYEGHSPAAVAYPIRVMRAMGLRAVILTNAAGGINMSFTPGDIMVVDDHINMTGLSPLTGPNDPSVGPRFNDMCHAYPAGLRALADAAGAACGMTLRHGVYVGVNGPQYETPAEIRMFRTLGGDAVGMSTVFEAIAAAHCGLPVLALSMITNLAAGVTGAPLSDEEVKQMAAQRGAAFRVLVHEVVRRI